MKMGENTFCPPQSNSACLRNQQEQKHQALAQQEQQVSLFLKQAQENQSQLHDHEISNNSDETGSSSERTRGPTTMKKVHTRFFKERKPIILNATNRPIGPDYEAVNEFTKFLGRLARNSTLAPLDHLTWNNMPTKDALWDYVLEKYDVPLEGKKWVLATIGASWRLNKCRFKAKHYYKYENDKLRMLNRPKNVPEDKFRALLNYWNSDDAKRMSETNIANRRQEKNMHTAGNTSFVMTKKKMRDEKENEEPSRFEMENPMSESSIKVSEEFFLTMKTKWQEEVIKEMRKQMEVQQAAWNKQLFTILSQIQSLNPELNLNLELLGTLIDTPEDANSALNCSTSTSSEENYRRIELKRKRDTNGEMEILL